METDRELLELAAKASGLKHCWHPIWGGMYLPLDDGKWDGASCWNPLTDDGDALRLAVRLNLSIVDYKNSGHTERRTSVKVWEGHDAFLFQQELHGSDPYAATRRAIVRAAAEIGRSM
jgi:hypothetical protein